VDGMRARRSLARGGIAARHDEDLVKRNQRGILVKWI
jgi:hypothetical protein